MNINWLAIGGTIAVLFLIWRCEKAGILAAIAHAIDRTHHLKAWSVEAIMEKSQKEAVGVFPMVVEGGKAEEILPSEPTEEPNPLEDDPPK